MKTPLAISKNRVPFIIKIIVSLGLSAYLSLYLMACSPTVKGGDVNAVTPTTPSTPTVVTKKLAAGLTKAFALTAAGTGQCWGSNYDNVNGTYGQLGLGLGTNTTRNTPTTFDASEKYLSIVSGEMQSCGLTADQKIKCWGANNGDGTGVTKNAPTLIDDGGTIKYVDLVSGSYHVCGLTDAGEMKCWGDGWDGKLGNGDATGTLQNSPVTANPGTVYKKMAAGRNHTCAITSAGALQCWGTNDAGQIGDGTTTTPRLSAVSVDVGVSYADVFAGENTTCAITTAGVLKCWGENGEGQVGDSTNVIKKSPTVIDTGTTYKTVALGGTYNYHTCGITTAGVLKCWGNNGNGQLGIGNTSPSLAPVVVDSGVSYREVSVYYSSSCGITTTGILKCWGANDVGQLGTGGTTPHNTPTQAGTGY